MRIDIDIPIHHLTRYTNQGEFIPIDYDIKGGGKGGGA